MVVLKEVSSMFWGLTIESGKHYTQTVERSFHISMAAIEPHSANTGKGGNKGPVSLMIQHDKAEFVLCTLEYGKFYQQPLDLNFTEGEEVTFFLMGSGIIHLSGYLIDDTEYDSTMNDPDFDLDEMSDSDESDDDSEEDAVPALVGGEDDEDSDEDEDEEDSPGSKKRKKKEKEKPAKKKAKVVIMEDDDEDESEDDDSEDDLENDDVDDDDDDDDLEDDTDDEDVLDFLDDEAMEEEESEEEEVQQNKAKKVKKEKLTPKKEKHVSEEEEETQHKKVKKEKQTPGKDKQVKTEKTPKKQETPQKDSSQNAVEDGESSKKKKKKKKKKNKSTEENAGGDASKQQSQEKQSARQKHVLKGGVLAEDLKVGHGPEAKSGKMVHVYYTGKLAKGGKQFDSCTKGKPFRFRLGKQEVIQGWDSGLAGMKVGGKRILTIPPQQGYGAQKQGPIPPNSTLVFEVELKAVS